MRGETLWYRRPSLLCRAHRTRAVALKRSKGNQAPSASKAGRYISLPIARRRHRLFSGIVIPGLIQPQSIADNLVISSLDRITSGGLLSDDSKHDLVARWVADLGVKIGLQGDAISTLSGGNQQRIAIAKWLATDPKLLILDEPTVGVDVGARAGIFDIVAKLADSGLAIILISDEVPEVYFNADRVLHMAKGRIANWFTPSASPFMRLGCRLCVRSFNPMRLNLRARRHRDHQPVPFPFDRPFLLAWKCLRLLTQARSISSCRRTAGRADRRRHRYLFAVAASVVQYITAVLLGWMARRLISGLIAGGLASCLVR